MYDFQGKTSSQTTQRRNKLVFGTLASYEHHEFPKADHNWKYSFNLHWTFNKGTLKSF